MLKRILLFTLCVLSNFVYSQLSNKHWIPPLHARDGSVVSQHYIYISTPNSTPFEVAITDGAGTPIAGSPFTISQGNPQQIFIGNGQNSKMFRPKQDINVVTSEYGLILEGRKDFYASFRVRSGNHAETLISKGRTAAGTDFEQVVYLKFMMGPSEILLLALWPQKTIQVYLFQIIIPT